MLRAFAVVLLLILPTGAFADSTTDPNSSATNSLQQTSQPTASQGLDLLQPASGTGSPLQSADAASGGAAQSAAAQTLQQTGDTTQTKLMVQGDGDQPHQLGSPPDLGWLLDILLVLVIATVLTAAAWLVQKPRPAT